MPRIKFIGNYDVRANGKLLLEILAQLKNFGVGRVVTKNEWQRRFPHQPSYLTVRKVSPEMDRWLFRGKVWGDWTYRGKNLGLTVFAKDLDRADWRLIHRDEESTFCKCTAEPFTVRKLPAAIPLPSLLRELSGPANRSTMVPLVPYVDEEHAMLEAHTELDAKLNPSADGTIYDIDPSIYFELYGEELPLRLEKWGDY